jgi:hypothetical protein
MMTLISPRNRYFYYNDSVRNLLHGIQFRVLGREVDGNWVEPVRPVPGHIGRTLRSFRNALLEIMPSTPAWSVQRFLDSYDGRKREMYQRAAESLVKEPLGPRDGRISSFLKREKIKSSVPRIIQPRTPRYNVEVGRYLKPAEGLLYKAIQSLFGGSPVVAKGMNALEVASLLKTVWDKFDHPAAVGFDAVRFDQHISKEALLFEHTFWNSYWQEPALREWLSWQTHNVAIARARDGVIKYEVHGGRMSGDMNTSSGNVFLMCGMVWAFREHLGVHFELVNNGDDCVIICEERYAAFISQRLQQWFTPLGFPVVADPIVTEFEKIQFCQMQPVLNWRSEYIMVRNFDATMEKDPMSVTNITTYGDVGAWCRAVGLAGSSFSSGIPVYQSYYAALSRAESAGRSVCTVREGLGIMSRGLSGGWHAVTQESRYSFYLATGLVPAEQMELELYFDELSVDGTSLPLPNDSYQGLQPGLSFVLH